MGLTLKITARTKLYKWARLALENARPRVSKFPVGAAGHVVGTEDFEDRIVTGSNNETKRGRSIHAELSLISDIARGEQLTQLIVLGKEGTLLAPCGDCREFLIDNATEAARILLSSGEEEVASILLGDLLPNVYDEKASITSFASNGTPMRLFNEALRLMKDRPYNPYTGELQATAVLTEQGSIFAATTRENAAYHHDFSVEIALGMADAQREREIAVLLFLHDSQDVKFPGGRSRQKLYEASQIGGNDFKVISASTSGELWFTTAHKLYPFPFGPKDLGTDGSKY